MVVNKTVNNNNRGHNNNNSNHQDNNSNNNKSKTPWSCQRQAQELQPCKVVISREPLRIMPTVSQMAQEMDRKACEEILTENEISFLPKTPVDELRHKVKQYLKAQEGDKGEKLPLSTMKRADLEAACQERGLEISKHVTCVQMRSMLREYLFLQKPPAPTDPITFGKHRDLTYQQVKETEPGYCRWAMEMAEEEGCSLDLKRFAGWLRGQPQHATKSAAKAKPKAMPKMTASSSSPSETAESQKTMEMLTKQVTALGEMMMLQAANMDEMKRQMAKRSKSPSPTASEGSFHKIDIEQ
jgi:hypothetical protein